MWKSKSIIAGTHTMKTAAPTCYSGSNKFSLDWHVMVNQLVSIADLSPPVRVVLKILYIILTFSFVTVRCFFQGKLTGIQYIFFVAVLNHRSPGRGSNAALSTWSLYGTDGLLFPSAERSKAFVVCMLTEALAA
jgi:hypothetical protein